MRLGYWSALVVVVGVCAAYVYHRDLARAWDKLRASEKSVEGLRQEQTDLQNQVDTLKDSVSGLSSDPVEVETSVRRNKNLVRQGERIYRIELPGE